MVQGLQHVASGWFPATSLSPVLVIFWVWYVVQWYICPFAFVVVVQLCLKSCKRRVLLLRWGLSVTESDQRSWEATVLWWISIFKDGLGRGEVGGGRRKLFEPHSLCSYRASQSAEALLLCVNGQVGCMSPCLHPCLDPPPSVVTDLLSFHCGVCVCLTLAVYMNILHSPACKDLFRSVSITEHLKTREPHSLLLVTPTCLTWITRIRVWIPLIDIWKTFWGAAVVNPPVAL